MASSTGWSSIAVAAVVATVVAAGTAALFSPAPPRTAPGASAGETDPARLDAMERSLRSLEARVAELKASPPTSSAPAPASGASPGTPEGSTAPRGEDGIPGTRGELEALIDARLDAAARRTPPAPLEVPPRKKISVDEAADEMGLDSRQRENLRLVQRETEEDLLEALLGTRDPARLREEALALRDDPERKEKFIQTVVANAISNAGKLMTLESKRDRRLREFLDKEQVRKLKGMEMKSQLLDDETAALLEDVF